LGKLLANKKVILLFTMPALILFTLFMIYPLIQSGWISFFRHDSFNQGEFTGFFNYKMALTSTSFWLSVKNTYILTFLYVIISLPVALILAAYLHRRTSWVNRFFKTSSFIPSILSVTVLSQMWKMIFQPEWGLLNVFLRSIGLEKMTAGWLSDSKMALYCIIATIIWNWMGYNIILFYAGLKTIPDKYYQAAELDGINFWQSLYYLTIPLMQEVIKIILILSVLGGMVQFDNVRIMTDGGPGEATNTFVYFLYRVGFRRLDFGQGCAIAILFALNGLILITLINRFVAKKQLSYI
jgi:ABC-type sugar transport system permease subunit